MISDIAPTALEKLLTVTVLILALGGMGSITALLFAGAPGDVFVGTLLFLLIIAVLVNTVVLIRQYTLLNYLAENYIQKSAGKLGSGETKPVKKAKN